MHYRIGEFSRIAGLSVKTLRFYHECGLLEPVRISGETGYRYYDEASLDRARVILELRALDFSIKEVKEMLESCNDDVDLREHLIQKSREISTRIRAYRRIEKRIRALLTDQEDPIMTNQETSIVEKEVEDMLVASIRFKGRYQDVGKAFGKLCRNCGRHIAGKPFSLYYDAEYKEEDADIEACIPVKKSVDRAEVKSRALGGGRASTLVHMGPYETIGESYKVLLDHVKAKNLEVTTPFREIYLKGPGMFFRGNPKKYVTEIQVFTKADPT